MAGRLRVMNYSPASALTGEIGDSKDGGGKRKVVGRPGAAGSSAVPASRFTKRCTRPSSSGGALPRAGHAHGTLTAYSRAS